MGLALRRALDAAGVRISGATGFSAVEIWSVAIGLQVVLACGLALLYRPLADDFGRASAALAIFACWLGTSLFFYSAIFPFMAHAVSFALLVCVMYATRALSRSATDKPVNSPLALLGFTIALLLLVRPQQAVIGACLLPLLARSLKARPLSDWTLGAAAAIAMCLAAVAIQFAANDAQFGELGFSGYSVGNEGFRWLRPQLRVVLLNHDCGLLVYHPVVVIAVLGYALFWRTIPAYAWPAAANALAQLYVIAAWSSPQQGNAFGARMWSDNAAAVAVGIAVLFRGVAKAGRRWVSAATVAAVGWTTYQLAWYVTHGG